MLRELMPRRQFCYVTVGGSYWDFSGRSGTKSYKSLDKQADDKVKVHIF